MHVPADRGAPERREYEEGERVRVWWSSSNDDSWYDGTVLEALPMVGVTAYRIAYDDGDVVWHHIPMRMAPLRRGRKRKGEE